MVYAQTPAASCKELHLLNRGFQTAVWVFLKIFVFKDILICIYIYTYIY